MFETQIPLRTITLFRFFLSSYRSAGDIKSSHLSLVGEAGFPRPSFVFLLSADFPRRLSQSGVYCLSLSVFLAGDKLDAAALPPQDLLALPDAAPDVALPDVPDVALQDRALPDMVLTDLTLPVLALPNVSLLVPAPLNLTLSELTLPYFCAANLADLGLSNMAPL